MKESEQGSLYLVLASQVARHPRMQIQDLYKLLQQAVMGSEHAMQDAVAARVWLAKEVAGLGEAPDEPLYEPISPDGQIVRVHLRPYVQNGMDPEMLLNAFIQTANKWQGSPEKLMEYGLASANLAKQGMLPFAGDELISFWDEMKAQGFPAVHHSDIYELQYHPAYRVVAREYLEEK